MDKTSKNRLIFLSWSGPSSKEVATVLKTFLSNVLKVRPDSIYLSDKDINGNTDGWYNEVCRNISNSAIIISCITRENKISPWLHFETGVGSYIDSAKPSKKIIPFLFDINIEGLPRNLSMFLTHQIIDYRSDFNEDDCYRDMLKKLICVIDGYIDNYERDLNHIYKEEIHALRFVDYNDSRLMKLYGNFINKAIKRLVTIKSKYNTHDFFISRPIKGIDLSAAKDLTTLFDDIQANRSCRIYYAGKDVDYGNSISSYRMGIIKQCNTFILIYPRNDASHQNPPSSSLIELGAALALNKRIIIITEKESITPRFFDDLRLEIYKYEQYDNFDKLRNILLEVTNNNK